MQQAASVNAPAYRQTRAELRAAKRARANARVTTPIPDSIRAQDPLRRASKAGAAILLVLGLAAVAAHVLVIGTLWVTGSALAALNDKLPDPRNEPIELTVLEPPPPPPPVEAPPPEPEPEPEPEPKPKPVVKPKPKPKLPPPPPPDPIDVPKDPPPPPPPADKPPPRRIVGLSLGSTVKGGSGPSFSVGNTRMGQTAKTAADPNAAKTLPKTAAPPPKTPPKVNRVATRVPTEECKLQQPRAKGPTLEPAYPKEYEAQELEAKVVLELRIGKDGRVMSAKVVKPSKYVKFNDNALKIVKRQRFTAASCKGRPGTERELTIPWTYTYVLPEK